MLTARSGVLAVLTSGRVLTFAVPTVSACVGGVIRARPGRLARALGHWQAADGSKRTFVKALVGARYMASCPREPSGGRRRLSPALAVVPAGRRVLFGEPARGPGHAARSRLDALADTGHMIALATHDAEPVTEPATEGEVVSKRRLMAVTARPVPQRAASEVPVGFRATEGEHGRP